MAFYHSGSFLLSTKLNEDLAELSDDWPLKTILMVEIKAKKLKMFSY